MSKTKIEWTAGDDGSLGESWNPVRGCVKVSPGCKHCYAETLAERFRGVPGHAFEQGFDLRLVPEKIDEPLRWKKPRRVFVNSMSDLFQDGVPWAFVERVFEVMDEARRHTFQVLTKRAAEMRLFAEYWSFHHGGMPPNVWLGVSCEDRKYGLPRLDELRATPAAVRFVSFEPLLERIDDFDGTGIHWAIVGGESGPGARPFAIEWAILLKNLCEEKRIPFFLKQMGARPMMGGERNWLGDRKGGDMHEWPEFLRVREFPIAPPVQ